MAQAKKNKRVAHERYVRRRNSEQRRELQRETERKLVRGINRIFDGKAPLVTPTADGVRMSEVLERFVDPYRPTTDSKNEYIGLLRMGMIAWNIALLPASKRKAALRKQLAVVPDDGRRAQSEGIVLELIARKEQEFPDCRRAIVDFALGGTGKRWHLSVISTP